MKFTRRSAIGVMAGGAASLSLSGQTPPPPGEAWNIAPGPFQPNIESLRQYQCPEWFRDAKFGIWAHWGPQCEPGAGDWYAQHMYIQGHKQYQYHLAHYGHPTRVGFKDICHIWKADKWNPERLVDLYRRAGARYFVAMANHHDNLDLWNSKYQPWNSVAIGPGKDIVGGWASAARQAGLRFGVTVHCRNTWGWYERAPSADKEGPLQDVPYDRFQTAADGQGKWWEGLNPQDLYCEDHPRGEPPNAAYWAKYLHRVKDLIAQHHPDLIYFDDNMEHLGERAPNIAAHYYNANLQWNSGRQEAVLTIKDLADDLKKAITWEIESGQSASLERYPWQTDQCIGDWHYKKDITYQTSETIIQSLVDIVSKNGNMQLNIPVAGDGTIDDDEMRFVAELTRWMDVNGEGIFATRPWVRFGEGPTNVKGGRFGNNTKITYTAEDVRFTTKGNTLYAFLLAWPVKEAIIRSLGSDNPELAAPIRDVRMLGTDGALRWKREGQGLRVQMPEKRPCESAYALKITTGR